MATLQLAQLATHAWLLGKTLQRSLISAYFCTLQCRASLIRTLLADAVAATGSWWERRTRAPRAGRER